MTYYVLDSAEDFMEEIVDLIRESSGQDFNYNDLLSKIGLQKKELMLSAEEHFGFETGYESISAEEDCTVEEFINGLMGAYFGSVKAS